MRTYPQTKRQAMWFLRRVEKRIWRRYRELAQPGSLMNRAEQQAAWNELCAYFKVSMLRRTVLFAAW